MRITALRLKNFKRFTDFEVHQIPESAKLVVVVGPNGCGKSSLFDALIQWYRSKTGFGVNQDFSYYRKRDDESFGWDDSVTVTLAGGSSPHRGCLYVRTAYRNDPDFSIENIGKPSSPLEELRVSRVIQTDQTVSDNYRRLIYETMSAVYQPANDAKTVAALRAELIGQIRASMLAVFGDLVLDNISDPLGSGTFYFEKGAAKHYHYKNLSGGEKAAFDLLLDLHVKKKFFGDAIYCVDELETHLHTRVQGTLLREMVKIVPDGGQLWITTHSLGVIRAAQEMAAERPGSVAVIDFDGVDPDTPAEIVPSNLGRVSWEKLLSIALDDLSARMSPKFLVVCEGSAIGNRRKDFDAEIYNRILASQTPDVLFVSGGSSSQIATTGVSLRQTIGSILRTTIVRSLCDRDDKSPNEVQHFEASGDLVLSERNLESYLLRDDVIEALLAREGKDHLRSDAFQLKADALSASVARGNPANDLKSAAGEIYNGLKRLLQLQRGGNSTDAFLRDTMAPLIKPPMQTYVDMKKDILDRL